MRAFLAFLLLPVLSTAQDQDLSLRLLDGDPYVVLATNQTPTTLEVVIRPDGKQTILKSTLISPYDSSIIWSIEASSRDEARNQFNDTYSIGYYFGDPSAIKHDDSFLYLLPIKKGKKFEVSQSFGGKHSHNDEVSKYSVDFKMDIGTPVVAARSGIVVKVLEHFTENGGKELVSKANKVVIMHDDGTFGSYVHLEYNGADVEVGDEVKQGQVIGRSGNTGNSRGPHLHFVVRVGRDISVPIQFQGYEGKILKRGQRVRRK